MFWLSDQLFWLTAKLEFTTTIRYILQFSMFFFTIFWSIYTIQFNYLCFWTVLGNFDKNMSFFCFRPIWAHFWSILMKDGYILCFFTISCQFWQKPVNFFCFWPFWGQNRSTWTKMSQKWSKAGKIYQFLSKSLSSLLWKIFS